MPYVVSKLLTYLLTYLQYMKTHDKWKILSIGKLKRVSTLYRIEQKEKNHLNQIRSFFSDAYNYPEFGNS